ncbi:GntR family transcriptional regulator [Alicyclobacillus sp. SP_1]|uniref:GntR family transcriptional regulator n=1 Tax=Alicyclobacillus sp. SP_1 TaxID=2942475 RepID=UPI002157F455|nr:GntR family transcriptional regulator [Alicyclobacillus sp. SP_1]
MVDLLHEKIYQFVINEIKTGKLRPGDKVLSEKELAEKFGVSRITTKHALARMAELGVINRTRGKGSFVTENANKLIELNAATRSAVDAQSLSPDSFRGFLFGLVLPGFGEPFGLRMVHAIEKKASELGMYMLLKDSYGSREVEERAVEDFIRIGAKGLIVFPVHGEYYSEYLLKLSLQRFPLVLVDRFLKGIPIPAVVTDNQEAAEKLTSLLIDYGHKNIAFVSPPPENTSSIEERLSGYSQAFARHGLSVNEKFLMTDVQSTLKLKHLYEYEESAEDIAKLERFIKDAPEITAFVACEYEIACLIRQAAFNLDKKIPEDISIVCFDHSIQNPLVFTHVHQAENLIGETAVAILEQLLHRCEVPFLTKVPYEIAYASSVGFPIAHNSI